MPEETDEIVGLLGRELVSSLAPEELPLYPALLRQFQGNKGGRRGKDSPADQLLGFGTAEALALLTPVILTFASMFWQALMAEAAEGATHSVLAFIRSRLSRHREAAAPPLTPDQLKMIRTVAEREARRLELPDAQVGLLTDAMVGALAAPAT